MLVALQRGVSTWQYERREGCTRRESLAKGIANEVHSDRSYHAQFHQLLAHEDGKGPTIRATSHDRLMRVPIERQEACILQHESQNRFKMN